MRHNRGITILKWIAALILLLALLILAIRASGKRTLRQAYAALEADGRPMSMEEIIPPPVAPEDDAVPLLLEVEKLLKSDIISSNELCTLFPGIEDAVENGSTNKLYQYMVDEITESGCTISANDFISNADLKSADNKEKKKIAAALQQRPNIIKTLQHLEQVAEKTVCRGDTDYSLGGAAIMGHFSASLQASKLLSLCTLNPGSATDSHWQQLNTGLYLAELNSREPTLVSLLVGRAQFLMINNALMEACTQAIPSAPMIELLSNSLEKFDSLDMLKSCMDGERILYVEWSVSSGLDVILPELDLTDLESWQDNCITIIWPLLLKDVDHAVSLMYWQKAYQLLDRPYSKSAMKELDEWRDKQPSWYILTHETGPVSSYITQASETIAWSRLMRTGLSAIAYQQEHGHFPATLEAMNQPLLFDPFSDKPFIYKPTPNGFTLYSIGPDQLDDAGENDDIPWQHTMPKQTNGSTR